MTTLILNRSRHAQAPYAEIFDPAASGPLLLLTEHAEGYVDMPGYALVEHVTPFRDNGNVDLRAAELCAAHDVTRIIATAETDLVRAARLRERFGIAGQSLESAVAFRDKVVMKELAARAVDVPRHGRLESPLDALDLIDAVGYPVVAKPVDGAGSKDTFVLRGPTDLAALLRREPQGYEVEEFVEGTMFTLDGLWLEGRLHLGWTSRYVKDCLAYQQGEQASMVQLEPSNPLDARLRAFLDDLFGALPVPELTALHVEVFHTPDDRLVLCEAASRTGGGGIVELGVHRFGVDIHRAWLDGLCGGRERTRRIATRPSESLFGFVQIPPRPGRLEELPAEAPFDWVVGYRPEPGVRGRAYGALRESSDKIAVIVVEGGTEAEVVERMERVTAWMHERCVWSSDLSEGARHLPNDPPYETAALTGSPS